MTRENLHMHSSKSSKQSFAQHSSGQSNAHQYPKITHFDAFNLFSPKDESLKRAAKYVETNSLGKFRVCVVSIISKEALGESVKDALTQIILSKKCDKPRSKLNEAADIRIQSSKISNDLATNFDSCLISVKSSYENQVSGRVDCKSGVIVLNLTSFQEAEKLYSLCLDEDPHVTGSLKENATMFASNWPLWNQNLIKTMLILMSVSNIVVFYNPELSLDYNLIHLFKLLESTRLKAQARITDLLESITSKQLFPQQWIRDGRLSCPRALFVCDSSHLDTKLGQEDLSVLRHDLEDQIYKLFKKTYITTPPALSSSVQQTTLFVLPERDDFVFILTHEDMKSMGLVRNMHTNPCQSLISDFYSKLFQPLQANKTMICNSDAKKPTSSFLVKEEEVGHKASAEGNLTSSDNRDDSVTKPSMPIQTRFKAFVKKHITDIQSNSSSDNFKFPHGPNNLLPRYNEFFCVLLMLKNLLFPDNSDQNQGCADHSTSQSIWSVPDERRFVDIYDMIDCDRTFSKTQCHNIRLMAQNKFARMLTEKTLTKSAIESAFHSSKLLYSTFARGSAMEYNLDLLDDHCNSLLESFNQQRAKSCDLRGKNNRNFKTLSSEPVSSKVIPNFVDDEQQSFHPNLVIKRMANGIKMETHCHCGRLSKFMICPEDRKRKLERVDIRRMSNQS